MGIAPFPPKTYLLKLAKKSKNKAVFTGIDTSDGAKVEWELKGNTSYFRTEDPEFKLVISHVDEH